MKHPKSLPVYFNTISRKCVVFIYIDLKESIFTAEVNYGTKV